MAVIATRHMVEIAVFKERPPVHAVHEKVQTRKCKEAVERKVYSRRVEKVAHPAEKRRRRLRLSSSFHLHLSIIEKPDDRSCVNEWINFEMHCKSEQEPSERSLFCQHRP